LSRKQHLRYNHPYQQQDKKASRTKRNEKATPGEDELRHQEHDELAQRKKKKMRRRRLTEAPLHHPGLALSLASLDRARFQERKK
jgi:hypothetical protein